MDANELAWLHKVAELRGEVERLNVALRFTRHFYKSAAEERDAFATKLNQLQGERKDGA